MKLDIQKFAGSEFSLGTSGKLTGKIQWSSKVVAGTLTSKVTATILVKRTDSSTTTGQSWTGYVKIGSTQKNISLSSMINVGSSWVKLATLTDVVVNHNPETGKANVKISGKATGPSGTSLAGVSVSGNKDVSLDEINVGSTINNISSTSNMVEIGNVVTANVKYNNVTTNLRFEMINSNSGEIVNLYYTNITTSGDYTLEFDADLVDQIEQFCRDIGEVTIIAVIEENPSQSKSITLNLKANVPIFTEYDFEIEDTNPITLALNNNNNKAIILGYSKLRYKVLNPAIGQDYAEFDHYEFLENGIFNRYGKKGTYVYPYYTNPITYNSEEVKIRAYDTRGVYNEVTGYMFPIKYQLLNIKNFTAERVGASEELIINAYIQYWNDYFVSNKNRITKIQYRVKKGDGDFGNWKDLAYNLSDGYVELSNQNILSDETGGGFDTSSKYSIQLRAYDGINSNTLFNEVYSDIAIVEDGSILDSHTKTEDGYKYAINGLVDDEGETLQVFGNVYANNLYYKPGETFTLDGRMPLNGYISSSTQRVYILVPTNKSLKYINEITCNSLLCEARGGKGYLNSASGFIEYKGKSGYTITCTKASEYSFQLSISKSTAFTNVDNNTLVCLELENSCNWTMN